MSRSLRLSVLLLALFLTVLCRPVEAQRPPRQPAQTKPDPADLGGITLVTQKTPFVSHLSAARRAIEEKDWPVATTLLQKLLDLPADLTVLVTQKGPGDKETKRFVGLRSEAEQLVGTLPAAGRAFYQLEYGLKAAELLKEARFFDEPALFAEVMRRYLHTAAGFEATERLATHQLDRGHSLSAALYFEKLIQSTGPEKFSALTLFKATLAFRGMGDRNRADLCWKHLKKKVGKDGLELGKRKLKIDELRKELDRRSKPSASSGRPDWAMFRGDASRSARAAGTAFLLDPTWSQRTSEEKTTQEYLEKATRALRSQHRPVLSSFHPIAATRRENTSEIPLVIYCDYWGVHARVARKVKLSEDENYEAGDVYWEAPSTWSVDRMLNNSQHVGAIKQWMQMYQGGNVKPEIILENSVTGSLSTDNVRVYMVEDFTIPPYIQNHPFGRPGNRSGFEEKLNDAFHHNRLQAYELESGKLLWEIGNKVESKKLKDLEGTYFLGPPLPLERKLFALAEKPEGLCLVTLDAATGKVLGSRLLGKVRERIVENPFRRLHAAPLAHAEGILVCPTNAGAVFGFDLVSDRLLWAHAYRDKDDSYAALSDPRYGPPPPGKIYLADGRLVSADRRVQAWAAAGPILAAGRVIFTAPDSVWLRCLSLRDGRLLWKYKRQDDDVYVGGVVSGKVLVVGSKTCRALNLDDGRQAWSLETGVPSGVGVIAGEQFYLPLAEAARTKEPGVSVLDVGKGRIIARSRSRTGEAPGNLLFASDYVLSQTPTQLTVYPQLEPALKRINELLAKNPADPEGRARRAFLRLGKGDLAGAVEDLLFALKQEDQLDAPLARQVRHRLFEALTEYVQRDFTAAEQYLKEYERSCRVEAPPGADEEERKRAKAEQARRMGSYYFLLGRGREAQGKFVEAARAYLDFADLGAPGELVPIPDDPALRVAPATFVRRRIEELLKRAPAEQRKKIEAEIERRLEKSKSDRRAEPLRSLVALFGADTPQGREARLLLAERLTKERDFAEAEQLLLAVRRQRSDVTQAARAVDALARLCLARNMGEDAVAFYRELGRDFPKTVVRDGKTGAELLDELKTDKRFLPFLSPPPSVPNRLMVRASEERGSFPLAGPRFELERGGDDLPFFRRQRLALRLDVSQLQVLDRATGEERWSQNLTAVPYFQRLLVTFQPAQAPRFCYENLGHLVLVQTGHLVFALDPVARRVLWEKNLAGDRLEYRQHAVGTDGRVRITYTDGRTLPLDLRGMTSLDAVCLPTSEGLVGVNPVDGHTLWARTDLPRNAEFIGDGRHLFIVSVGEAGAADSTQAVRIADGTRVAIPNFSSLYSRRHQVFGGTLVLAEKDDKDKLTLRQYDALTGKDVWKKTFAAKSIPLTSHDETLAGAVQPDGKLTVFDLATRKELLSATMRPEHLAKVSKLHLFRDARHVYVPCEEPSEEVVEGSFTSNLMPGTGLRSVPVNGSLYAFEAASGELNWYNRLENLTVVLNHLDEMPLLLLTSRYQRWADKEQSRVVQVVTMRAIDKRTGKLLYDKEDTTGAVQPIQSVEFDRAKNRLELSYNLRLRLEPVPDAPIEKRR